MPLPSHKCLQAGPDRLNELPIGRYPPSGHDQGVQRPGVGHQDILRALYREQMGVPIQQEILAFIAWQNRQRIESDFFSQFYCESKDHHRVNIKTLVACRTAL